MSELQLLATVHPDEDAQAAFDALLGIGAQKHDLLDELVAQLDPDRLKSWERRHHPKGVRLADRWRKSSPLILLSGEVGCGKTALATSVGTPLSRLIDKRVVTMETPSDLRGHGHVGEMSARITEAFSLARRRAKEKGAGILVIDEADDVATARAQMQAHHEDRAGLNVLIKQVDQLARSGDPMVVILITNRHAVLDPAVRRRAALHLAFVRPDAAAREEVFRHLLDGLTPTNAQVQELVRATERTETPYSYSDLIDRLARTTLREAQRQDCPISAALMLECLTQVPPSPLMER